MPKPKLDPYLFFDGNCAEAMQFYQRTLGGRMEAMLTYGQSPEPAQCPPGNDQRIMHACIDLDGQLIMASDCPEGQPYAGMKNVALSLVYPTVEEAKTAFAALSEGGRIVMPMGPTFWSEIFGMLTDRFGMSWMIGGGPKPKQAMP